MAYTTHRGKRVSRDHAIMLAAYERQHGPVYINQGARTLAEQAAFYAHYLRYGSPLAARPWGGAPHIKWGAAHHAMDINAPQPAHSVADFYRAHGVPVAFNVRGEGWHMDTLDAKALHRAALRLGNDPTPTIYPKRGANKAADVKKLKKAMWAHGLRKFSRSTGVYGPSAIAAIKRLQKKHGLKADGIVGDKTWRLLK
jgi:hypothetical protein